jgi:hypothetical protein
MYVCMYVCMYVRTYVMIMHYNAYAADRKGHIAAAIEQQPPSLKPRISRKKITHQVEMLAQKLRVQCSERQRKTALRRWVRIADDGLDVLVYDLIKLPLVRHQAKAHRRCGL